MQDNDKIITKLYVLGADVPKLKKFGRQRKYIW